MVENKFEPMINKKSERIAQKNIRKEGIRSHRDKRAKSVNPYNPTSTIKVKLGNDKRSRSNTILNRSNQ